MSNPLDTVLEAHGGLERWSRPGAVSARPVQGALRALTGQPGALAAHLQRDLNGALPWES
jgi:hypothetical protein